MFFEDFSDFSSISFASFNFILIFALEIIPYERAITSFS